MELISYDCFFLLFIIYDYELLSMGRESWGEGGRSGGEGEQIRLGRMVPFPGDLKYTGRGEGNRG